MIEDKIDNFLNAPEDSLNFGDLSKKKLMKKYLFIGVMIKLVN